MQKQEERVFPWVVIKLGQVTSIEAMFRFQEQALIFFGALAKNKQDRNRFMVKHHSELQLKNSADSHTQGGRKCDRKS